MPGIWQKRFHKRMDPLVLEFTCSLDDDSRLAPYDVAASSAHVRMLAQQGILSPEEQAELEDGLKKILADYKNGKYKLKPEFEDIHMNVEKTLDRSLGGLSQKLHTARSRNDLVAMDLRLYARDAVFDALLSTIELQKEILKSALKYYGIVMPGYTHLQQAQPILWSFFMLSHFFKFQRDIEGLQDALKRVNVSPLGSCALAGTSHAIDPEFTAALLHFPAFSDNALDAVSDRDFICEISFYLTQVMLHIATLAEDIILFSTKEFDLVELDDSIATGSSIMPQKKNPDVCELLRAKSGKAIGHLVAMLTILKALPSSYNRDLQEIKGIFFDQTDNACLCLEVARTVVGSITPKEKDWPEKENFICATDIVDHMVRNGRTFREAYDLVAECVKESKGQVRSFVELCAGKFAVEPGKIAKMLKPINSVKAKQSPGSTSPGQTKQTLSKAKKYIRQNEVFLMKAIKETKSDGQ